MTYEAIEDWSFELDKEEDALETEDFLEIARCHDTWEDEIEKINQKLDKMEKSQVRSEEMEKIFMDIERLEKELIRKYARKKDDQKSYRTN